MKLFLLVTLVASALAADTDVDVEQTGLEDEKSDLFFFKKRLSFKKKVVRQAPLACQPGFFGTGGNNCFRCPIGSFKPQIGNVDCTPCPAGTLSSSDRTVCTPIPTTSTAAPSPCPAGFFGLGGRDCTVCPFGFITPVPGLRECNPCPIGTESTPDRTNCLAPATPAAPTITPCNAGFFGPGNPNCQLCPVGYVTEIAGLPQCSPCPPGTTSNGPRTTCIVDRVIPPPRPPRREVIPCPRGTAGRGDGDCTRCRRNFIAPRRGLRRCRRCKKNKRANGARTKCVRRQPQPGPQPPQFPAPQPPSFPAPGPPVGFPVGGPAGGFPCPVGHYGTGGYNCQRCPVNHMSYGGGCKQCPYGTHSNEARSNCVQQAARPPVVKPGKTAPAVLPPKAKKCGKVGQGCGNRNCCNNLTCSMVENLKICTRGAPPTCAKEGQPCYDKDCCGGSTCRANTDGDQICMSN